MIRELKVENLNGRFNYEFEFYEDLNLFAGHIGTGKTTLLKLIWFLTSGNLHRVISEIPFDFVSIYTSEFLLSMEQGSPNQVKLNLSFETAGEDLETSLNLKRGVQGGMVLERQAEVDEPNKSIACVMESSLFFPTFRRMERHAEQDVLFSGMPLEDARSVLRDAFTELSKALSVADHKFIIAASTYDLIDLLTGKHTEIAEGRKSVIDDDYDKLVGQWNKLDVLVHDIYTDYNGIHIIDNIILGTDKDKTENPIPSANLSSGEKQLLGFLCHNAFSKAKSIFIDEPELSLHEDWQRLILTLLEYQGTERQFFAASHSPFIIKKYDENLHILEKL